MINDASAMFLKKIKEKLVMMMTKILFIRYHLKDVIVGKIYFLLVRIKIKTMELEVRRRESTGSGTNTYVETETLSKYELMDGVPVRGMHFSSSFVSKTTLYSIICIMLL